jgi:hypothetical protein
MSNNVEEIDIIINQNNLNTTSSNDKTEENNKMSNNLINLNDEYHSNNECPICFNTISKEQLYITNCNHVFCKSCLDKWFNKSKFNCPSCRKNIYYVKYLNELIKIIIKNQIIQERIIHQNLDIPEDSILLKKTKYYALFVGCFTNLIFVSFNLYFICEYL